MEVELIKYTAREWELLAQASHFVVFNENRDPSLNRIDFALLMVDKKLDQPAGFVTIRELDKDSIYWQFGGIVPQYRKSINALQIFEHTIEWCKKDYKRITMLIKNDNFPMLKFAIYAKAKIIGCRIFHGEVYVEHLIEF